MPQIKNLQDPTDGQDAATRSWTLAQIPAVIGTSYGSVYAANAFPATSVPSGLTWTKLLATTTFSLSNNFDDNSGVSNRLRYTGAAPVVVQASYSVSLAFSVSNQKVGISIFKNGSLVVGSATYSNISGGIAVQNLSATIFLSMTTNDYIEVWINSDALVSGNTSRTDYQLSAIGI